MILFGIAPEGWIFCLGIPVMAFWGLAGPATQSLMTRRVSSAEQGQLQGAIAGINGVTGLIGPILFTQTSPTSSDRILPPVRPSNCQAHRSSSPRSCSSAPP